MPKLNKAVQKKTEAAEEWKSGGFLLPEGRYAGRLGAVTEREGAKAPYWSWEFTDLHNEEGETQSGRQWHNTSLSEKALGNMKSTFAAFGYSLDSDTEEMVGEWAVLQVSQEVAEQGKKAGQTVNRINGIAPFIPEDWDFDPELVTSNDGSTSEDNF